MATKSVPKMFPKKILKGLREIKNHSVVSPSLDNTISTIILDESMVINDDSMELLPNNTEISIIQDTSLNESILPLSKSMIKDSKYF